MQGPDVLPGPDLTTELWSPWACRRTPRPFPFTRSWPGFSSSSSFLHEKQRGGCGRLSKTSSVVVLPRIRLAWPDPPKAIQVAREALDLAMHPDRQYAWGEADAAQVCGEAYFANHEPALAHRAFTQALAVRKRIEHPGIAETEKWLAMTVV